MANRAVFVVNSAKFFLSHRIPVAREAERLGLEVHVAAPDSEESAGVRALGFHFHPIPMGRRTVGPFTELRTVGALTTLYRDIRPVLVHHVTLKSVLYGSYAARLARVPSIVNAVTGLGYLFVAGNMRARFLRSAFTALARPALRARNAVTIFQNEDDMRVFASLGLSREDDSVLIRGSGVNTSIYRPSLPPRGVPLVVLPSRMLWDKGVGVFVEAAALLKADGLAARFALVGEPDSGNPRSVPATQLEAWQASGAVEVWGQREDMPAVFSECSIVALPSQYREGVPKVLIEAASCARPIVTTDIPGCRDIVRDGDNGFVVPPGDARALASALARLVADPALRIRMGLSGRSLVEREFSEKCVVSRTSAVYEQLLARGIVGAVAF